MQPNPGRSVRMAGLPEHGQEEADEEDKCRITMRVQHQPQLALGADRRALGLAGQLVSGRRSRRPEMRLRLRSPVDTG